MDDVLITGMSGQPLISIVIPAFNAAAVLGDALRSIQEQHYEHFEAIVVDDGSTDGTGDIARSMAAQDGRIVVLDQPNGGIASARNTALRASKGAFIAFLDADDVWLPDKLRRQVDAMSGADLVFSNYFIWDGQTDLRLRDGPRRFRMDTFAARLTRFNLIGVSTVIVRRELLERVGLFDQDLKAAEDWDYWLRAIEAGARPFRIADPLARYRIWNGNTTHQKLRMAQATVRVLQKRLQQCHDPLWRERYRASLAIAEGNLRFAMVRPLLDSHPESLAPAALKAWLGYPKRVKWLVWYLLARWPPALGGNSVVRPVHRRIKERW